MDQSQPVPSSADLIDHLVATDLFGVLDRQILQNMAADAVWMTVAEEKPLFHQGDVSDGLYIVVNGRLQAIMTDEKGTEHLVDEIQPGETIGDMQIFTGRPRPASVVAVEEANLVRLPKTTLDRFVHENSQVMAQMSQHILYRFRQNQLLTVLPPLFGPLNREALQKIWEKLEWVSVGGDEALIKQGEPGHEFYILISGRLLAKAVDGKGAEHIVDEVVPGESVGEMQLLTGKPAYATVYAARDSELIKFSEDEFEWLITTFPQVLKQITIAMAADLQRVAQGIPVSKAQTDLAVDIVVVPAHPDVPLADFTQRLAAVLEKWGTTLVLDSQRFDAYLGLPGAAQTPADDPASVRLVAWLNDQETRHRFTLYQTDSTASPWTRRCLRQADVILIVGLATSSPTPGEIETQLIAAADDPISTSKNLILLYEEGQRPMNTKRWLEKRQVDRYFHVRATYDDDFNRLGRQLTRRSLGLVLGGGGARGYAHIGVIRALREAGMAADLVGGTSMGAIIAGQYAMGWDYETMVQRSKEALPRTVLDYTFPLAALIRGRNWTGMLQMLFGETQIEDLWVNFFCVSSNLTQARAVIHETGSLWEAIRASTAIPGVIPPLLVDGDLLVDGGLVNNLPVDIMLTRNDGGPLLTSDVSAEVDLVTTTPFGPSLSGWHLLWQRLNPFVKTPDIPTLGATLMRSSLLSSAQSLHAARAMTDFYIYPPVEAYGTLEFDALEKIIEIGYHFAQEKVEEWKKIPAFSQLLS